MFFRYNVHIKNVVSGKKHTNVIRNDGVKKEFDRVVVTAKLNRKVRGIVISELKQEIEARQTMEDLEMFSVILEGERKNAIGNGLSPLIHGQAIVQKRTNGFFGVTLPEEAGLGQIREDPKFTSRVGYFTFYSNQ